MIYANISNIKTIERQNYLYLISKYITIYCILKDISFTSCAYTGDYFFNSCAYTATSVSPMPSSSRHLSASRNSSVNVIAYIR